MSSKYEKMKITLSGAQGSGKTTLMNDWSKKHNSPILRAATRLNLPEGAKNHLDIIKLASTEPEKGIEFQDSLIKQRFKLFESANDGFISDRSVFDSYVYYAITNSPFSTPQKDLELLTIAYQSITLTDLIVILDPRIAFNIQDDNVRLVAPSYYSIFFPVLYKTLSDCATAHEIEYCDFRIKLNEEINGILSVSTDKRFSSFFVMNESVSEKGIFSRENRIELIEKACDFLDKYRKGN